MATGYYSLDLEGGLGNIVDDAMNFLGGFRIHIGQEPVIIYIGFYSPHQA